MHSPITATLGPLCLISHCNVLYKGHIAFTAYIANDDVLTAEIADEGKRVFDVNGVPSVTLKIVPLVDLVGFLCSFTTFLTFLQLSLTSFQLSF